MTDDNTPRSGSRWEPTSDATAPPAAPVPPEAEIAPAPPAQRSWRDRTRGKSVLAGAAAGLIVVSGLGGFAVAQAVADGDEIGLVGTGFHGDRDGDDDRDRDGLPGPPPGFDHDGPDDSDDGYDDDDDDSDDGYDDDSDDDQTGAGATT